MRYREVESKNKIYFQFNKIAKTPNSFFSHKLLAYAHRNKKQTEVLELLFYKYFIEGEDIGSLDVLIKISKDGDIYDDCYFEDKLIELFVENVEDIVENEELDITVEEINYLKEEYEFENEEADSTKVV